METNREIITSLTKSYQDLSSKPAPKFKKTKNKEEELDSRLVINKDWKDISDRRIDLIMILDNPGKNEKAENRYLSLKGEAGRMGRDFIDQYSVIHKKSGQVLVLNKTPFWSNKSTSLYETTDSIVKESVEVTFKVLERFWNLNNNISIFVLGLNKDAIMNQYFFKCLKDCNNESFKRKFFFGKHPSYGHLGNQFASALVSEINIKRRISMHRVFKQFNKLNRKTILNDFELRIY